jgi:phospholipid transport system transporter-binding protein
VTTNGSVARENGAVKVAGALTFQTVPDFLARSKDWMGGGNGAATIDLGEVTRADSAGVALLLEWLRLARDHGREVRFVNAPEQLRHLIQVNGLTQILLGEETAGS